MPLAWVAVGFGAGVAATLAAQSLSRWILRGWWP